MAFDLKKHLKNDKLNLEDLEIPELRDIQKRMSRITDKISTRNRNLRHLKEIANTFTKPENVEHRTRHVQFWDDFPVSGIVIQYDYISRVSKDYKVYVETPESVQSLNPTEDQLKAISKEELNELIRKIKNSIKELDREYSKLRARMLVLQSDKKYMKEYVSYLRNEALEEIRVFDQALKELEV